MASAHSAKNTRRFSQYGNAAAVLYRVRGEGDTYSHSHSEAQLQHVLDGSIKVGGFTVDAGMTFAVPSDYRYGNRSPEPWEIVVYRRDVSLMRRHPKDEPHLEG